MLEAEGAQAFRAVDKYLANIEKKNPSLNAFLQIRPEEARKRAQELDGRLADMAKLPLFGVPIAIKDNFQVRGWQTTAGSKILNKYIVPYTATAWSGGGGGRGCDRQSELR